MTYRYTKLVHRQLRTSILAIAIVPVVHAQSSALRAPVRGAPAGVTAFVDVGVVPMDTERILSAHTVLVQNGWIVGLGPSDKITVPAGAMHIDGEDKYLIPGLGDCHAHIGARLSPYIQQIKLQRLKIPSDSVDAVFALPPDSVAERRLFTWLADGVTTVRNLDYMDRGTDWLLDSKDLLQLRARVAAGELLGPRIYTAGQWAPRQYTHSSSATTKREMPDPQLDSVFAYISAYKAAGYDILKIHEESPEVFLTLLAMARQVGMPVVGHVPNGVSVEQALAGGMRSIEHLDSYRAGDTTAFARIVAATRRAGTWNCVTLQAGGGSSSRIRFVKALQEAGAGLLLGSDEPLGDGIYEELELLVRDAGLTSYQALTTGTKNIAAYFNTLEESGTVAVGKRADLVLLSGNPLEDIRHIRQPAGVMLGGRWLARAELDRRLAAIAASGGAGLPGHNQRQANEPKSSEP